MTSQVLSTICLTQRSLRRAFMTELKPTSQSSWKWTICLSKGPWWNEFKTDKCTTILISIRSITNSILTRASSSVSNMPPTTSLKSFTSTPKLGPVPNWASYRWLNSTKRLNKSGVHLCWDAWLPNKVKAASGTSPLNSNYQTDPSSCMLPPALIVRSGSTSFKQLLRWIWSWSVSCKSRHFSTKKRLKMGSSCIEVLQVGFEKK